MDKTVEGQHRFYDLAKEFSQAMLVTLSPNKEIHARPMQILKSDEKEGLWFVTPVDSPKIDEIQHHDAVNVCMQSGNKFLSISGKAKIIRDEEKIKEMWSSAWKLWFPHGKHSSDISLINVEPKLGEYWDWSGIATKLRFLFEAGRALLYSTPVDYNSVGESGKVDLCKEPKDM